MSNPATGFFFRRRMSRRKQTPTRCPTCGEPAKGLFVTVVPKDTLPVLVADRVKEARMNLPMPPDGWRWKVSHAVEDRGDVLIVTYRGELERA